MARRQPPWSKDLIRGVYDGEASEITVLRQLAVLVEEAEAHADAAREERDAVAARLRGRGVAMVDIARWARVSDSYLTRRLLKRGVPRRNGRALPKHRH